MDQTLLLVIAIVILGLAFEFVNGFHDAANAIATVVATRVLSPRTAVIMAGTLNFVGAVSGTAVAVTLGSGIVDPTAVTPGVVAIALTAAIIWDLITWYMGLPTSSSHALIFGVLGAAVAFRGTEIVIFSGVEKTSIGIIYSPLVSFLSAGVLIVLLYRLLHRTKRATVSNVFGKLQVISSAYMAFSHGGNDGQKTMGIIALALFSGGFLGPTFHIPLWVMVTAALAIGLGTALGGWRIIKTMGTKLVELQPVHGFAAETAAGTVIEVATRFGVPISTTHAISGAILGAGLIHGRRRVRWGVAGDIVAAWILTIPGAFGIGWGLMQLASLVFGRS